MRHISSTRFIAATSTDGEGPFASLQAPLHGKSRSSSGAPQNADKPLSNIETDSTDINEFDLSDTTKKQLQKSGITKLFPVQVS
jgi:hypothetical protein